MRFLTPAEWQAWCSERQLPLQAGGKMRPDLTDCGYHVIDIPYGRDSGAKVWLARELVSLFSSEPEWLFLVDDWDVWPSSQHLPLFTRLREALGESRTLEDAPGHIVNPSSDTEDAVSIVATSLFFIWGCYGISSTGRDVFSISHDEYCTFASRDQSVAERLRSQFNEGDAESS